jgi:hypothetical protein
MRTTLTARQFLDRDFLEVRTRLLDIAAALDRIDRAADPAPVRTDPKYAQLLASLPLLADPHPDRAERLQMHFSLPYDPNWRG